MTTFNVKHSLVILFVALHVSFAADVAASARAKFSTPQASATYEKAKESVVKSLARANDMANLLTRTRKELRNLKDLKPLDDCIKLAGVCVADLKAVSSELAKGEGQLNKERAEEVVVRMSEVVINEDTCLLGLPDESSDRRLAELVDKVIMADELYAESLKTLIKALKP